MRTGRVCARAHDLPRLLTIGKTPGRDPGYLYTGARLAVAEEWAGLHPGEASIDEAEFLRCSREAQFIARDFKEFIRIAGLTHVRTSPYYPQSNGKIERWHKSLKTDCIRPGIPLNLQDARRLVIGFVEHYNTVRLHSAIGYITPADKLVGKEEAIFAARDQKLLQARETRKTQRNQNNAHSLAVTLTFSN